MPNYQVVSEVARQGQWLDIPDSAVGVSVLPLDERGNARVLYLERARPVPIHERGGDGRSDEAYY